MHDYSYMPDVWLNAMSKSVVTAYEYAMLKLEKRISDGAQVVPQPKDVFKAFHLTPPDKVKCVILGLNPAATDPGVDDGLAFSCYGESLSQTLINVLTELEADLGYPVPKTGDLSKWAEQGVLLLNTTLTAELNDAHAHYNWEWKKLASEVIRVSNNTGNPVVYNLWGAVPRRIASAGGVDRYKDNVIVVSNPSPISFRKGFYGTKVFSRTNEILVNMGAEPIDWNLNQA